MITLYGFGQARSFRCLWALEESELPYKFKALNVKAGESQSEAYLKLHPEGKVPALEDGGFILNESGAILNYIASKCPGKRLIPEEGSKERALYDQTLFFVLSELEQPLWTTGKHKFALPKELRVPEIRETTLWEFKRASATLQKRLGDRMTIVGDEFTGADIMVAHTLNWAESFKFPLNKQLKIYKDHHYQRPACQRAVAIVSVQSAS